MGKYEGNPDWAGIEPIPLNEGTLEPLAAIAFSDDYLEATSYLRAVMAKGELSDRVLALTGDIINMNPSHYTVWLYRAKTLLALKSDLAAELEFLYPLATKHQKNYQIWQHRQTIVRNLGTWHHDPPLLADMLTLDSKNHHVWSYRQWMVSHFELWDEPTEWNAVESLLAEDVRNNSAWNHRWFLVFGAPVAEGKEGKSKMAEAEAVEREWRWALEKAALAPQNESAWNYLRALVERATGPARFDRAQVIKNVLPLVYGKDAGGREVVTSSYGLDVLAELYAETGEVDKAGEALDQLATKWDPIRAGYWNYRKSLLSKGVEQPGIQAEARTGGEVAASA